MGFGEWYLEVMRNLDDWEVREYEILLLAFFMVRINESRDNPLWSLNTKRSFSVFIFKKRVFACTVFLQHLTNREIIGRDFRYS